MQGTHQQYDIAGADICKFNNNKMDAIWEHPDTKAKLFLGGESAASNLELIRSNNVSYIVNCRGQNIPHSLENTAGLTFHRFCVLTSASVKTPKDTLELFKNFFDFVDEGLDNGKSVLIHCLAGAHRAPTATAAYLMYKTNGSIGEIRSNLKSCRPIVDLSFGSALLINLGEALPNK